MEQVNEKDLLAEMRNLPNIKMGVVSASKLYLQSLKCILAMFVFCYIVYDLMVGFAFISCYFMLYSKIYLSLLLTSFASPYAYIPAVIVTLLISISIWEYIYLKETIILNMKNGALLLKKINKIIAISLIIFASMNIAIPYILIMYKLISPEYVIIALVITYIIALCVAGFVYRIVLGAEFLRLGVPNLVTGIQNILKNKIGKNDAE